VASLCRWFVIALAKLVWGFPLSVVANLLGCGYAAGWLVAANGVLLGDLCCFIWWRALLSREKNFPTVRTRRTGVGDSLLPAPADCRKLARPIAAENRSQRP